MSEAWDDDRLLHEGCWAAEALIRSMKEDGCTISPKTADFFINLRDWTNLVRSAWTKRDNEARIARQAACEHEWTEEWSAIPQIAYCKKCQLVRAAETQTSTPEGK